MNDHDNQLPFTLPQEVLAKLAQQVLGSFSRDLKWDERDGGNEETVKYFLLGLPDKTLCDIIRSNSPESVRNMMLLCGRVGNMQKDFVTMIGGRFEVLNAVGDKLAENPELLLSIFNRSNQAMETLTSGLSSVAKSENTQAYEHAKWLLIKLFEAGGKHDPKEFVRTIQIDHPIPNGQYSNYLVGAFYDILKAAVKKQDAAFVQTLLEKLPASAVVELLDEKLDVADREGAPQVIGKAIETRPGKASFWEGSLKRGKEHWTVEESINWHTYTSSSMASDCKPVQDVLDAALEKAKAEIAVVPVEGGMAARVKKTAGKRSRS